MGNIDDAAKPAFVLFYYDSCFWAKQVAGMEDMVKRVGEGEMNGGGWGAGV